MIVTRKYLSKDKRAVQTNENIEINDENLLNTVCLDFHKANKSQLSANRSGEPPRTNARKIKPPNL